jgi:hypothetical protein
MTIRDDLVAQVEEAIRGWAGLPDATNIANAAVDAVAIYVYEQLASGEAKQ